MEGGEKIFRDSETSKFAYRINGRKRRASVEENEIYVVAELETTIERKLFIRITTKRRLLSECSAHD